MVDLSEQFWRELEAPIFLLILFLLDSMSTVAIWEFTLSTIEIGDGIYMQTLVKKFNYQYFIGLQMIKSLVLYSVAVYVSVQYIHDWKE